MLKRKKKALLSLMVMVAALVVFAVPAFAADVSGVAITSEMLEPIVDMIIGNIAVILPVGIIIFGVMIGIALAPRILKKFTRA